MHSRTGRYIHRTLDFSSFRQLLSTEPYPILNMLCMGIADIHPLCIIAQRLRVTDISSAFRDRINHDWSYHSRSTSRSIHLIVFNYHHYHQLFNWLLFFFFFFSFFSGSCSQPDEPWTLCKCTDSCTSARNADVSTCKMIIFNLSTAHSKSVSDQEHAGVLIHARWLQLPTGIDARVSNKERERTRSRSAWTTIHHAWWKKLSTRNNITDYWLTGHLPCNPLHICSRSRFRVILWIDGANVSSSSRSINKITRPCISKRGFGFRTHILHHQIPLLVPVPHSR